MKYRKKPVVIEAVQWKGFHSGIGRNDFSEQPEWLIEAFGKTVLFFDKNNTLTIKTLEGDMFLTEGDFLIKGIQGELYPCKPDIFEATYEEVI